MSGVPSGRDDARRTGAASVAVADLLEAPPAPATVLGTFPRALYLDVGGRVLAVVASDGIRLPNAVVLSSGAGGLGRVPATERALVGGGEVRVGPLRVEATRRWDPVPRMPSVSPASLAERVGALGNLVRPGGLDVGEEVASARTAGQALEAAAARGDGAAARAAVPALVGAGGGLTPAGDDVLAGFLAGLRLLPRALATAPPGHAWRGWLEGLARGVATDALAAAPTRTTAISAALLAHAARGEVAVPVGDALRALAGEGALAPAVERLQRVGHSSGRDLAQGLLSAGRVVLAALPAQPAATPTPDTSQPTPMR